MKTRPIAAALLLAFAPAMFPTVVRAQSGADDPTTSMARARFKEGVEFYDKGEYEQARAAFLQAYALKKHPAVLLNLAWSCLRSGHTLEAERYFKQFLAEGKDITEKQRADANDGLSQTHAKLGRIEIQAPAGTDVTIDGDHVGTTPLGEAVSVEAGAHTVKFKAADGATDIQSVSVLGGEKAIARSGRAAAAPAAPIPVQAPPATEPSAPPAAASPPPSDTTQPTDQGATKPPPAAETGKSKGLLSPPSNMVPVYVFGGIAIVGYVAAVSLYFVKQSAQNNADSVQAEIEHQPGAAPGICNHPPTTDFQRACSSFITDRNDVNSDALAGNVALGVGIAASLGTAIYWLAANKGDSTTGKAIVAPMIGASTGGLLVGGRF